MTIVLTPPGALTIARGREVRLQVTVNGVRGVLVQIDYPPSTVRAFWGVVYRLTEYQREVGGATFVESASMPLYGPSVLFPLPNFVRADEQVWLYWLESIPSNFSSPSFSWLYDDDPEDD